MASTLVGARTLGVGLGALCAATAVAGTWLAAGPGGRSLSALMGDNVLNNAVNGLELGLIAGLLMWLRPAHRVGWLLMYAAAANALAVFGEGWALASYDLDLPGRVPMAWLGSWVWATALVLGATVLPACYPTGRAVGRTGRWVVRLGWGLSIAAGLALATLDEVYRSAVPGHTLGANPVSHGRFQGVATGVAAVAAVAGLVLVVFTLVWTLRRLRRAASPEREQLAWLVAAVVPSLVAGVAGPPPVLFVVNLLSSLALVVGIVWHQLFDIKLVLRSGLVYGLLIALAVVAYLGVVELVVLATPGGVVPRLFAAAAVALVVVPAYRWLTGAVGRLVYGDRADPVRALGRIAADGGGEGADLPSLVAAVAASVRSPHVAVRAADGGVIAATGDPAGHPAYEVSLRHEGVDVGTLSVSWRTAADRFAAADRRLLDALATPVAVAVHAAGLAEELGRSRTRMLAVREAERRRLRNDLHDGLGPSLSGVALGIEAALRSDDPARLREILGVVHGEVTGLVTGMRGIIDDLGPAGLEAGGLLVALRAHAEAVSALGELEVTVVADPLPELPRPVEVALHRIAAEALTNVVRHAQAGRARVSMSVTGSWLRLTVADDGVGLAGAAEGVGRSSMRERAEAVGGRVSTGEQAGGGTEVVVLVPLGGVDG